jgi:HEAT repeats
MKKNAVIRRPRFLTAVILCLGFGIGAAQAGQGQFVNAKVEALAVGQHLEKSVEQVASEGPQPEWVGYGVEAVAGNHSICCGNDRGYNHARECGTCNLEQEPNKAYAQRSESETVKLEGQPQLIVLLRMENRKVRRIRLASGDCTLDAGELRVVWLTGVQPEESVALLTKYVEARDFDEQGDHRMSEEALTAIALHADASADRAFAAFVAPGQPASLREKASFWLGAARGKAGLIMLQQMAKNDPSPQVREQVSFALSVSSEPGGLAELIHMAQEDESPQVRGQALFWLGQKAGKKTESAITSAILNDPDTEVKEKAVFALSQMPKDEGVPKLIEVAQTNRNPEVRKRAMFWLGQSGDPRALAFFEKVLSK